MANPIKYNTGSESRALNKGNWWIGTGDVGKGPTGTTGFWNGYDVPAGGYVVYLNKATGGPSIYSVTNDAELISLTNQIAGTSYTTVNECFTYFAGQSDKIIIDREYEPIVTENLTLNLDAGFLPSYPKNGNTWYNLSGNGSTGTLYNSPGFNSNGYFEMDGTDDIIYGWNSTLLNDTTECTMDMYVNITQASFWGQLFYIGVANFNHNIPYVAFYTDTYDSNNHKLVFGTNQTSAGYRGVHRVQTSIAPYLNEWTHIAGVMGDGKLEMFINGTSMGVYTLPENWQVDLQNQQVHIGGGISTGYVSDVNCKISTARIYNRGLSSSEILQNYNAQRARFGV